MQRGIATACLVAAVAVVFSAAASAGEAFDTSGWVGANYTPAYCSNQVRMWHDFRPDVIDRELAAAKEYFGLTSLRVYLHNIVFDAEKDAFLERIERFLVICDKHGIRPGFVFFDDCWNHKGVELEAKPPVDGRHNGRWAACPQDIHRTDEHLPKLKAYVQETIAAHRDDKRVLWWEIFNEPKRRSEYSNKLRVLGYKWAKEMKPTQPVICCWDDSPETDIVNAHNYSPDFAGGWNRQADLNPAKGTVFTEAGARWFGTRPASNGSPIEVVRWLKTRKAAGKTVPGVYLCWELMVGNSHCRWYWGTKDGTPEPAVPWCGLLWPDCTPVSLAEAEAVREYVTGERRALLFDDFAQTPPPADPPGWKRFGAKKQPSSWLELAPGTKMIADAPSVADCTIETSVMLKSDRGNAGLIFRVNDPGQGYDAMRGYYVGFDTKTLYLGSINNNWRELARCDLTKLGHKITPNEWNLLRVQAIGGEIKVWLNRTHDAPAPRITHTLPAPIKPGAIGLRAHRTTAWFDYIVVIPK